ncbi:response regulator, partial [Vibrio metschnikovii]|nr:response regulator [Vibrio metschnikovii]
HQVDGVDGGRSALDLIKNKNYQIIITDCNMPDINGYELARKIREYENENNNGPAYIIGYTANAQQEVVNECLQSGMNDCLFKPITIDGLEKVLLDISMENNLYYSPGNEINQKDELLDINKLVSLINNEEVVLEILREFLIQNEKDINMLTSFVSDGKIKESQSLAHKMKSGSNIIGCISMSEKCSMIEQSQSIEEMISIMNDLVEINSSVTITINEYLKK